ncbi:MAG: alpha-1,4-glucan--maltose-1-phosphate maltosyltransferase [Acidobacteriota bacterium]
MRKPSHGRNRVVIEAVTPQLDCGRYAVRRIVGDAVHVGAAIYADGHDVVAARVLYKRVGEKPWRSASLRALGNDLWSGSFAVDRLGEWIFTVEAWIDHFAGWAADMRKRLAGRQQGSVPPTTKEDIALALRSGALLLQQGAKRARGADARKLAEAAQRLEDLALHAIEGVGFPVSEEILRLMDAYPDLTHATRYEPELPLWVDRERARFSAWYELFPRSASPHPGRHGTFADVERQLPEIAAMGFDILYMPPIHPIGRSYRKGPNNTTTAPPGAPGSPWAIGDANAPDVRPDGSECEEGCGGHKSIHPELGSFEAFDRLVKAAKTHGIEIALDIAFQCSPDHPWVKEHPDWFVIRPDGTIQYAENPPKKYQDIYPLNFESQDWRGLWDELYSVFEFWIERGVTTFRVDNPHTKALPFWEWCLGALSRKYPETIYLAEAFTRPHVMYGLAKRGFTQSYTYFTWRNTRGELEEYLKELTQPPVSDFFRPNFWPNTPDILHRALQEGGPPAFMQRIILAATLAASYGIYGPAYELAENAPAAPAPGRSESEEYLNSEKYEIRQRDRNAPGSLVPLITKLNQIRRENVALHSNESLRFHPVENPNLICYSKATPDFDNLLLMVVNLDAVYEQSGWTDLDLGALGLKAEESFVVQDLLNGGDQYVWKGRRNFVALRPGTKPAHVFRVRREHRA